MKTIGLVASTIYSLLVACQAHAETSVVLVTAENLKECHFSVGSSGNGDVNFKTLRYDWSYPGSSGHTRIRNLSLVNEKGGVNISFEFGQGSNYRVAVDSSGWGNGSHNTYTVSAICHAQAADGSNIPANIAAIPQGVCTVTGVGWINPVTFNFATSESAFIREGAPSTGHISNVVTAGGVLSFSHGKKATYRFYRLEGDSYIGTYQNSENPEKDTELKMRCARR
ncbi:MAG: hypothetical protein HQL37_03035 [Alphaproteobacteria bacterium]|nr:hypothetical protein [Alphaproteobacteria bacterium]